MLTCSAGATARWLAILSSACTARVAMEAFLTLMVGVGFDVIVVGGVTDRDGDG